MPHTPKGRPDDRGRQLRRTSARGLAVAVASACFASVGPPAWAQSRPFVVFGSEQGLRQLVVQSFAEDGDGKLWAGTEGGLHVLQGDRFEEVSVDGRMGRHIEAMAIEPDGTMWVATTRQLFRGPPGAWTAYPTGPRSAPPHPRTLHVDGEGTVWLGSVFGLFRWRDRQFEPVSDLPKVRIVDIESDRDGRTWVGTADGLFVRAQDQWTRASAKPVYGLATSPLTEGAWVAFRSRIEHRRLGRVLRTVPLPGRSRVGTRRELIVDRYGVVWAASDFGAVEIDGPEVRVWGAAQGLPIQFMHFVHEDREGGIWFGGTNGVVNLPDRSFARYRSQDGLPASNVRPLARTTDGRLWVGSSRGIAYRKGQRFVAVAGLTANVSGLVATEDGGMWVGSDEGLHHWGPRRGLRRDPNWSRKGPVTSLALHPDGTLWIAGYNQVGLVRRARDGTDTSVEIPDQTLLFPRVMVAEDGRVWVSGSNGLSVWDGAEWMTFRVRDGLVRNDPYHLAEDDRGRIWFGYHGPGGVTRFDGRTFKTFTEADGLANNRVFSIGADGEGNIWLGSAQGVDRFDGERFTHYTPADGYPSNESNAGGFLLDHDGSLWMSTLEGLAHFRQDRVADPLLPPALDVARISVGGSTIAADGSIDAPHGNLEVEYAVRSRYRRRHVEVRYRVDGLHTDWQPAPDDRISVDRLPPGEYAIVIQARRRPGPWATIGSRDFRIRASLWTTPWLWSLAIVPIGALGWLAQRFRLRRAELRNRRLTEMVEQRTSELARVSNEAVAARDAAESANRAKSAFLANMSHEIRTPLNAVLGTTSLLMSSHLDQDQRELALTAQRSSEALLELVDEILDFSRIEAGHLEIVKEELRPLDLVIDTLRLVSTKAHGKGISLAHFVADDAPSSITSDESRLRQVLLNLVGNAVKFTPEGEVAIEVVRAAPNRLRFVVTDTGIGIPEDAQATLFHPFTQVDTSTSRRFGGAGLGLAITHRLVTAMGGTISVDSAPGQGAAFSLTVPIEESRSDPAEPAPRRRSSPTPDGVSDKTIDIYMPGPVGRRAVERWVRRWGAEPRLQNRIEDLIEQCPRPGAAAIIGMTRANADVETLIDKAGIDVRRVIRIGPVQLGRDSRTVSEPVIADRLYEALDTALGRPDVRAPASVRAPAEIVEPKLGETHPLDILLVDDNQVNREVARRMLQRLGYDRVRCVDSGLAALTEVQRERPDLVFMDVQMPDLDGLETTRRLRRLPAASQPRIVALTAGVLREDRQACADAGMDDFVAKPIRLEALKDALRRCTPHGTGVPRSTV